MRGSIAQWRHAVGSWKYSRLRHVGTEHGIHRYNCTSKSPLRDPFVMRIDFSHTARAGGRADP